MSKRTRARAKFRGAAKLSGHSSETIENRMRIAGVILNTLWDNGMPVHEPRDIELKHVRLYIQIRLALGIVPRALQNEISALRALLKVSGCKRFATSPEMRSKALGIPEGSRIGTNLAITDAECADLLARAEAIDPATACVIRLERTLGLRGKEGVMSPESLPLWKEQLQTGNLIHVTRGTKGGRERFVNAPNKKAALDAVRAGIAFCAGNEGRFYPRKSLEQALRRYGHVMGHRLKVKGHCLRYAFAKDRFWLYRQEGSSEDEALMLLSRDLGHGDKRGRWVRQVYLRNVLPPLKRGRRTLMEEVT
jgi:hypothetical protein